MKVKMLYDFYSVVIRHNLITHIFPSTRDLMSNFITGNQLSCFNTFFMKILSNMKQLFLTPTFTDYSNIKIYSQRQIQLFQIL